jgi:hypothetical protein
MANKTVGAISWLFLAAAVGCNSGNEGLVPVSGKVTFDGGPPPAAGFVTFMPIERVEGKAARPARAIFETDGSYQATSFQPGDGVYPGRYNVSVSCNKGAVDYSKPDPFNAVSYVPKDYKGQELVIEEGSDDVTLDLDVPLKKG